MYAASVAFVESLCPKTEMHDALDPEALSKITHVKYLVVENQIPACVVLTQRSV